MPMLASEIPAFELASNSSKIWAKKPAAKAELMAVGLLHFYSESEAKRDKMPNKFPCRLFS